MKKIVLSIILLFITESANADWDLLLKNSKLSIYLDIASYQKVGHQVKMWSLWDYSVPQSPEGVGPYSSVKYLIEFDCKEAKTRLLSAIWFSGRMGIGYLLSSINIEDWDLVNTTSINESLWKVACGGK